MTELTAAERQAIDRIMSSGLCICGHPRTSHGRFVNGRFKGCQHISLTNLRTCTCDEFIAASREAVPELIAEIRRLQKPLESGND